MFKILSRCGLALLFAFAFAAPANAQSTGRIEVIEIQGIIDGSVERSVLANIDKAQDERTAVVVLQIDSYGTVGADRMDRIAGALSGSTVPIVTWVGPGGAQAANGAAKIAVAAKFKAMAPGSNLGPMQTFDLRRPEVTDREATPFDNRLSASAAEDKKVIDVVAPSINELLTELERRDLLDVDLEDAVVRFNQLDLFGRALHAAAQPSIVYLLLLVGLVGLVFELFHPSTGPAGVSGLAALALGCYGVATLGGSWIAVGLVVAGVAAFSVDLRFASLGAFTAGGLVALTAGSLLIFPSPYLKVSPWILAFGVISMTLFMVSAMTRVLRDLRAVARGELEVRDAHPHPNDYGGHE